MLVQVGLVPLAVTAHGSHALASARPRAESGENEERRSLYG